MKRIAVWVSVLFIAALGQPALARDCHFVEGEARWKIKTSVPAGALRRKVKPTDLRSAHGSEKSQTHSCAEEGHR